MGTDVLVGVNSSTAKFSSMKREARLFSAVGSSSTSSKFSAFEPSPARCSGDDGKTVISSSTRVPSSKNDDARLHSSIDSSSSSW